MRVLQVSQNLFVRGGSDRMFLDTCALLKRHGHEVIPFVAQHPDNPPSKFEKYFPVAADFVNPGLPDLLRYIYSRPAAKALRQLIADFRPDVAHLHIYYGKLTASILPVLKSAGVPIVHTMHEYRQICPNYTLVHDDRIDEACCGLNAWRAVVRRFNRNSFSRSALAVTEWYVSRLIGSQRLIDRFIAISDFQKQKMIEHGVPAARVRRVYNFVEPADPSRPEEDDSSSPPYVLYFGRIERIKGVFTLAEAAAGLERVRIRIVGHGEAVEPLRAFLRRRAIRNVELIDFLEGDALRKMVRGSLATVLPAQWYEPFGLTVLESFSQQRPVIASRIGALPELIDDGADGLLVDPGDASQLREAIQSLADDPSRAEAMGTAGRTKLLQRFTPEAHYPELMRVYEEAGARCSG
ncbi:MAG: glycosyltransferase family 4 protein [Phycisphaeraceae bacterium]